MSLSLARESIPRFSCCATTASMHILVFAEASNPDLLDSRSRKYVFARASIDVRREDKDIEIVSQRGSFKGSGEKKSDAEISQFGGGHFSLPFEANS